MKHLFEEAVRSANRVMAKNVFRTDEYSVMKSAIQESLKFAIPYPENGSKIFQKRALMNWEFKGGAFRRLRFDQIDERATTTASCRTVNRILEQLDYDYLAATSSNGEIESFNIHSNPKREGQKPLTSPEIDIDYSTLEQLKF